MLLYINVTVDIEPDGFPFVNGFPSAGPERPSENDHVDGHEGVPHGSGWSQIVHGEKEHSIIYLCVSTETTMIRMHAFLYMYEFY